MRFSLIFGAVHFLRLFAIVVALAASSHAFARGPEPVGSNRPSLVAPEAAVNRAAEPVSERIVPSAADEIERLRLSLLRTAERLGELSYVPYVWGGNSIGNEQQCQECRACREETSHLPSSRSASICSVCEQCGMDCSHFVHRIFSDAGLEYPYMATEKLRHMSRTSLRSLNLVDIGRDLRKALPGDLLLQPSHVVMLLAKTGAARGDVIHVNRSFKHGEVGGIEILRDTELNRLSARVVRILRHAALVRPDTEKSIKINATKAPRLVAKSASASVSRMRGR